MTPGNSSPFGLRLIAGVKLVKGFCLACLSLGVFDLIHKNLTAVAQRWVEALRISPENKYVALILEKAGLIDPAALKKLGVLSALYASVLLIEGFGLWIGAGWAEYMVVISTGLFVPEECLAIADHPTWGRLVLLVANVAILAYVVRIVWGRHEQKKAAREAAREAERTDSGTPG